LDSENPSLPKVMMAVSALGVAALFLWQDSFSYMTPVVRTFGLTLLAVFFASLLMMVLATPGGSLANRFFSSASLRLLGRYSYALYVLHFPVIKFTRAALYRLLPDESDFQEQMLVYAIALPISLGLAMLSWVLLEGPILRLKRYFQ
jgi:peptidoglycan/LPS O-acetylase OafA/YrhL